MIHVQNVEVKLTLFGTFSEGSTYTKLTLGVQTNKISDKLIFDSITCHAEIFELKVSSG